MTQRPEVQLFLNVMMGIMMFGVGAGLTPAAFRKLLATWRPLTVGLGSQLVVLPLLALALAMAAELPQPLAIGLVLLASCPGGVVSNLLSVVARADVALSITLTTVSTLLSVVTVPLWLGVAWSRFGGQPANLSLLDSSARVAVIAIAPVLLGMAFRHRWPDLAQRIQRPFRRAMFALIGLMVLGVIRGNRGSLLVDAAAIGPPLLALNAGAMLISGSVSTAAQLPVPQRITIVLETALQNAPLSITLALVMLQSPEAALPSLIYAAIMMPSAVATATLAAWLWGRSGQ